MSRTKALVVALLSIAVVIGIGIEWRRDDSKARTLWQQAVVPGALSQSHAFLSNNCAACHAPVKGVEPSLCISCHADNTALLQRQPTAFHAQVQVCIGCHMEHRGTARMPTTMDHALLAKVGHQELRATAQGLGLSDHDIEVATAFINRLPRGEAQPAASPSGDPKMEGCGGAGGCSGTEILAQPSAKRVLPLSHTGMRSDESMLNCASCHTTVDRHQGFFGTDCAQCHATTQWTIAEFSHPSLRSTTCAECHKPPPSHTMMHFSMMSAPLAGQPNATVNQCFLCHQTTSWNDIRGVGRVKMH